MATQENTTHSAAAVPSRINGFRCLSVSTDQGSIVQHVGGSGFPVLLLHGFPETSLMWRAIAPALSSDFSVIAADLPGYGLSDCPQSEEDHAAMAKRTMAASLVGVMQQLGHERFAIVGHDRGGRVAYRAALDHPDRVAAIAVLDIIPTFDVWERADARLTLAFWLFSLLAQPAPLPEQLILAAPDAIINNALAEWGSSPETFPSWLRTAYVAPCGTQRTCTRSARSIGRPPQWTAKSTGMIWGLDGASIVPCSRFGAVVGRSMAGTRMKAGHWRFGVVGRGRSRAACRRRSLLS